jgi:hypothetical protein
LPTTAPLSVVQKLLETTPAVLLTNRDDKGKLTDLFVIGIDHILEFMNSTMKELI